MIRTYYETSTGHITEKDDRLLRFIDLHPIRVVLQQYGWFINLDIDDCNVTLLLDMGFSEEFTQLLLLARHEGCYWLCLDRDAPKEAGIPYFDW